MRYQFFAVVVLVAVGFGLVATGPAAAQVDDPPNANETQVEQEKDRDRYQPIDNDTSLVGWTFEDGMFHLDFRRGAKSPTVVTITETTQTQRGVTQISVERRRISEGHTRISVRSLVSNGESAVGITTAESIEQGQGIVVSTGQAERNPLSNFGGTSGVLSGVGISILLSGGAAGWVIWREETGVIEA